MKTNVQLIKHIMEYSKHGALMQGFILDALSKYSQHIINNEDKVIKQMQDSFISGEAWVGCAKELHDYLNPIITPTE